jgi:catechol 2,3-dioxygenase-like lactoylglutathione lyase family enzyme
MLADAIAHATVSVTDLKRARSFYEGRLGFTPKGDIIEEHVFYQAGEGSVFTVYERPDPPKAENTAMAFGVKDVAATVKWLQGQGVVFEEYDFPGLKTVDGVADVGGTKAAWFKDPDGNILAVSEVT